MIFLTYNDAPDGIYFSQVIDVCRFWQDTFKERARLIAFISLRDFFVNKTKIRAAYPDSIVLPMFPGIENWKMNSARLKFAMLFKKKQTVIARGVFATLLAIDSNKFSRVCFDARGAYAAEWEEYMKEESPAITAKMKEWEREALTKADFRIAVSQKLVDYWKDAYGYSSGEHVIIPCTLDSTLQISNDSKTNAEVRNSLGVKDDEVLLVYSGSSAQWQSFGKLKEYLTNAFTQNPKIRLLMLSRPGAEKEVSAQFPGRVIQAWVKPDEVSLYLAAADYGLLIREPSITNKVSSPVKFAEYLAAGLPVIISEGIGDYSSFVKEKGCGYLVDSISWASLKRISDSERVNIQDLAVKHFSKQSHVEGYKAIHQL